jgi:hypothetical protein
MSATSLDLKDYDLKKIIEDKNYLNIRKRVEIKVRIENLLDLFINIL